MGGAMLACWSLGLSRVLCMPNHATPACSCVYVVPVHSDGDAVQQGQPVARCRLSPPGAPATAFLQAHTSIRFGIGRFTTEAEVDRAVELTVQHVNKVGGRAGGQAAQGLGGEPGLEAADLGGSTLGG